jgi:hypothetical protein
MVPAGLGEGGGVTGRLVTIAGYPTYLCAPEGNLLDGDRAAADLVGEALGAKARIVAAPVERLGPGFLDLSTRIAGEAIQKFVNYGLQVVFVGDISAALDASSALRDFVRESNRGGHVWFVEDLGELERKLTSA